MRFKKYGKGVIPPETANTTEKKMPATGACNVSKSKDIQRKSDSIAI